jgi:hypothetical protein
LFNSNLDQPNPFNFMSKPTVAKKVVSSKLVAQATKTFEELSRSKASEKTNKQISRSAKRLVKTVHALIKKAEKKKARIAKALAKKKAKEAKARAKGRKTARSVKTPRKVRKVPAN